ncbi:lysophospholipase [Pseudomonas sp. LS1212]|uniref:alpha/beta hydrolase n=1 Tax=Pseudomonas sp. LS1212 TaxID=2972478 RepID=UPI00215C3817|nr:lysophospholipase [Pseudomonas sp. LS1212]UVJ46292.1 lysophospholipase [Pseudomonas sp. LS1212]
MLRTVILLFALVVALYLGLCAALFVFQRSLIYFPQPRTLSINATILKLPVADAQVLVSARPHEGPDALIYFGGNAEDVTRNLPAFSQAFPNQAIYLLNYRGFGGSSGSPSEETIQRDALALFDMVHAKHPNTVIVGRSLGTGVAIHLASLRPASRLILITPYSSLEDLAAIKMPLFPVRWLLEDKFESWKQASRITVPTLLIVAEHDEIIPRANTEKLYRHFPTGIASLKVIAGTDHNSISESPHYLKLLASGM